MKKKRFDPRSFVFGGAVVVIVLGVLGLRPPQEPTKWDFRVTTRHSDKILAELGDDGWDYAGYFGESQLGGGEAIGLWKRPR